MQSAAHGGLETLRSSCDFEQAKRYRRTVDRRWQRLAAGFERQGIGKAMLCFASMLIAATAVAAPPPCMPLEPASVTLHGRMVSLVLPGAPNYERILGGDEPEKYFYLQLDAPICTIGANDGSTNSESLQGVRMVQLFSQDAGYFARLRPYLGQHVFCTGMLWNTQTGHHHGDIMMTVDRCEPLSGAPFDHNAPDGRTSTGVSGQPPRAYRAAIR